VAFDEALAARIRDILLEEDEPVEKRMFGGIAYMHRDHMFIGIVKDELMVRVGPDAHEAALKRKGARPMDFTGKPMKGYVYVEATAIRRKQALRSWVKAGRDFVDGLPPKKAKKRKAQKKPAAGGRAKSSKR
jgi:TfoX/Sxy family transcriptional regulator of competence genes